MIEAQLGEEGAAKESLVPGDVDREHHRNVGEEAQRQPLQVAHVGLITQVDLQSGQATPKSTRVEVGGAPDQQA